MGAYAFVLFALVGLGLRSQYLDKHDAGVAQQLVKQRLEEEEYSGESQVGWNFSQIIREDHSKLIRLGLEGWFRRLQALQVLLCS